MVRKTYKRRKSGLRGRGDYSESIPGIGSYSYKGNTPFASAGSIVGQKFGWPRVGGAIGHAVGRLFGSGDYKMGYSPSSNSLWNSTSTPKFASNGRGNIITNREYIGDIKVPAITGDVFNVQSFVVNPGLASVFPWLGTISQQYEQYRIHGMIFEFKSTLGDNSGQQNVGTVIMSTEYNVNAPNYINKQVMENAEFAQSAKATESQIHGIECAGKEHPLKLMFTKTNNGALPTGDSTKWYDFANFQIATVGFPAGALVAELNIGELWVSYQIEFFKPQIPSNIGGAVQSLHVSRTGGGAGTGYMGATAAGAYGTLGHAMVSVNEISLTGLYVGNSYIFDLTWVGTAAATATVGANFAVTNGTLRPLFATSTISSLTVGVPGAAVTTMGWKVAFRATSTTVRVAITGGVVPTNSAVDIYVTPYDNAMV